MHSKANAGITVVMDVYAKLSVQTYRRHVALGFTSLGNFCNKFQARQQRRTMIQWLPCCPWVELGICLFTSTEEISQCLSPVWVTGTQIPHVQKQQVFIEGSFAWHGIPETVITDNVTQFSCQGSAICSTSRTRVCHIPATLQPKQKQLSGFAKHPGVKGIQKRYFCTLFGDQQACRIILCHTMHGYCGAQMLQLSRGRKALHLLWPDL